MNQNIINKLFIEVNIKLLFIIIIYFLSYQVHSQDLHFTMYNNCPLYLNPANTGNFRGDWRISGNYRDQWRVLDIPFSTASVSFDKHFYIKDIKLDGGLLFMNDRVRMMSNKLFLSFAHGRNIFSHYLRAGLQVGYVFKSLNSDEITFPSQWDIEEGAFNSGFPSNITGLDEKISYLDINFGVLWKKSISIFEPEAGIALMHLTTPNESFFSDKQILPVRYVLHGRLKTKLSDKYSIIPSILYMKHTSAAETIFGTEIEYNLFGNWTLVKNVYGGLNIRNRYLNHFDAFTVMLGAHINRMKISVNYDLNISNLSVVTNGRGAFEISIIYESLSSVLNSYSIPCERF